MAKGIFDNTEHRSGSVHRLRNLKILLSLALGLCLAWGMIQAAHASPASVDESAAISAGAAADASFGGGVRLLHSDDTGLALELLTPDFQIEQSEADGQACQIIRVEGYAQTDTPGWPRLPVKGAMAGVPLDASPELRVLAAEAETVPGSYTLCPVAAPVVEFDDNGRVVSINQQLQFDPAAYSVDQFAPLPVASLVEISSMRSQRVALLRFQPFQYNPRTGELRFYRRIRVQLDFNAAGGGAGALPLIDEGPFEPLLRQSLVNYTDALAWRARPAPRPAPAVAAPALVQPSYKLLVKAEGIYQVTYADLLVAGVDFSGLDPHTFRLTNLGQEVAIYVHGQDDHSFDADDWLLFFGQPVDTRYTGTNVYYLTWGGAAGRRMPVLDGTPDGASTPVIFERHLHLELNKVYACLFPTGPQNDVWYWQRLNAPTTRYYTTTLETIAASPPFSATVRGLLRSRAATPEHHTKIYINNHLIADDKWPKDTTYAFEVQIPHSYLVNGVNTFKVEALLDGGITVNQSLLNWFEIDYWDQYYADEDSFSFTGEATGPWKLQVSGFTTSTVQVFDITQPITVGRVLGGWMTPDGGGGFKLVFEQRLPEERHYLALPPARRLKPSIVEDQPSDLHASSNGADYIIISHSDFLTDVHPLAAWRASQGLRTQVVDVEDVYDEFSDGIMTPQAIRDFLAYAYANWQSPAPAYVLLVGDGHFDPRDYFATGEPIYIPAYMEQVDPWLGETASENRFVTLGGAGDVLPDMYLGRFPVASGAQAAAMVNKTLAYEQAPIAWDWTTRLLFVADDKDGAGDFPAYSDAIADVYIQPGLTVQKVYYKVTHPVLADMRAAILNAMNQGVLMASYVGHASIQMWGGEGYLKNSDIPSINNAGKLPFMTPMTCLEGSFHYPNMPGYINYALAELLVREPADGAIASFSPTGLGVATGHDFLANGLYGLIFNSGVAQLGPATTGAKYYLYENSGGSYLDLIDTYALLGDPALRLQAKYFNYFPTLYR